MSPLLKRWLLFLFGTTFVNIWRGCHGGGFVFRRQVGITSIEPTVGDTNGGLLATSLADFVQISEILSFCLPIPCFRTAVIVLLSILCPFSLGGTCDITDSNDLCVIVFASRPIHYSTWLWLLPRLSKWVRYFFKLCLISGKHVIFW